MGEERAETRQPLSAQQPTDTKQAHIRTAAEESEAPWPTPPLPKPKLPVAIPAIATPTVAAKEQVESMQWNTSKLGLRVGVDAVAAGAAGVLVAPIITMIDKGIMENASGRNPLGESLKKSAWEFLSRPHRFLGSRPFALIFVRSHSLPTA